MIETQCTDTAAAARTKCCLQIKLEDNPTALDVFKEPPAALPDSPLARLYFGAARHSVRFLSLNISVRDFVFCQILKAAILMLSKQTSRILLHL